MYRYLLFFISFISILVGCHPDKKDSADKEAISILIGKYPELAQDTSEGYHLIRTVIPGNSNIGIKLYRCEHNYSAPHTIIVIQNNRGITYAIPLFSNDIRKYWNFENEPKSYQSNKYNSLFEKEFIVAINRLQINDKQGTGYTILFEIFHSLLHYQQLNELDKEQLQDLSNQLVSSDTHADKKSECKRRNDLNCTQILNGIIKSEYEFHYNAHFDPYNHRVFQLEFPKKRTEKIKRLTIKIYRFGCEIQPLFM